MRNTAKSKSKTTSPLDIRYILHLGLVLFIVTAVTALLLGFVNAVTQDKIAQIQEKKTQTAMQTVMSGADIFTPLEYTGKDADALLGAYSDTELVGYVAQVSPSGYKEDIFMVVGVDLDGKVTGASIVSHTETPGLGSKANAPSFLDQFIGLSGTITVSNGNNAIDGISGATITSKAVTSGVNAALAAVASLG